eukprot:ANDGO_00144.mRNA.1 Oxygen-independent coproporphyrinogen-III oxidase
MIKRRSWMEKAIQCAKQHPHDFTIQYPIRREYFKEAFMIPRGGISFDEIWKTQIAGSSFYESRPALKQMGLYVHVPFCAAKCFFCNFSVDTRKSEEVHGQYVDHVCNELAAVHEKIRIAGWKITGIDVGGGTPTLLSPRLLDKLFAALQPFQSLLAHTGRPGSVSIETTPRIAANDLEKLQVLYDRGVRRVSVGIQSTNAETLASVNRGQQIDMARTALRNLKTVGFGRVCADVIFALPGQSMENWKQDLQFLVDCDVDTVTTYDCLYRGKGRSMSKRAPSWPSLETYGMLYDFGYDFLTSHGYHAPYGSLNFSKHKGEVGVSSYFESRLLGNDPYIGVGNYATSMLGECWTFAPYTVDEYVHRVGEAKEHMPLSFTYQLPVEERVAKHVLLSLSFGILRPSVVSATFGIDFESEYADALEYARSHGWLMKVRGDLWTIPPGNFQNLPMLRCLFYPEAAIDFFASLEKQSSVPR